MKKTALTISIILLWFCDSNAQSYNCDYLCFIQTIDSLKTALIGGATIQTPKNYWDFNDLSVAERNQVLDYIETLYNQTDYMSFYHLGINLLVDMFKNDDKNIQDRIAKLYLENAFYVFYSEFTNLGKVVNYSDVTKERLKNILEGNRTEKDIKARKLLAKWDVRRLHQDEIDKKMKAMMKNLQLKGEKIKIHLLDSITNEYVEKQIQFYEKYPPLEKFTILQIGSSKDPRFIPGLEAALEKYRLLTPKEENILWDSWDYTYDGITEACTYALAKLGVQQYLDTIYAQASVNYEYLGTKEAFLKELDKQFVWNKNSRVFSNQVPRPSALIILEEAIMYHLKNVPQDIKKEFWDLRFVLPEKIEDYDPSTDEQNKESIKTAYKLYNWIKDNPDKWELPPAKDRF